MESTLLSKYLLITLLRLKCLSPNKANHGNETQLCEKEIGTRTTIVIPEPLCQLWLVTTPTDGIVVASLL